MTKSKRVLLLVSCVVLSLCIAFSALFLAVLGSSDRSVRAAESESSDDLGLSNTVWQFVSVLSLPNSVNIVFPFTVYKQSTPYGQIYGGALSGGLFYGPGNGPGNNVYTPSMGWSSSVYRTIVVGDLSSVDSYHVKNLNDFLLSFALPVVDTYEDGYNDGYSAGQEAGYNSGYAAGLNKGQSDTLSNPVSFFLEPLNSFMSIDLFGQFSVGDVFSVVLFVCLGVIVIKMFAGG